MKYFMTLKNERNTTNTGKTGNMLNNLKMQNSIRNNLQILVAKIIPGHNPAMIFPISSNPCLVVQQMPAEAGR